ncbi:MAG: putative FG-GAP repeat [Planctomycetota bacterium]|nr:MAG: putative FG-GAP repeat [Planctomycetota bacterium]
MLIAGVGAFLLTVGIVIVEKRGQTGTTRAAALARPAKYVQNVELSEATYEVANGSVKRQFVKGLKEMDWRLARTGLAPGFRGTFPAPLSGREVADGWMGVREYEAKGLPELGADAFLGVLRDHMAGWAAVERTTWRPFEFLLDPGLKSAFISLHFQVAGRKTDGLRADVSGTMRGRVSTADGKIWRIERLEWVEGTRLDASRPPWVDVTDETGLHFNESEANRRIRRSMIDDRGLTNSGSLVVSDWNRDGFPDVLACVQSGVLAMFLNDGKGGFVREKGPEVAPDDVAYAYMALDLDGDGSDELVSGLIKVDAGGKARFPVYIRRGEGWETRWIGFDAPIGLHSVNVEGIVPADLDRDGDLDLFFACYSNGDSKHAEFNRVVAHDGADNYLFVNQGGLKFTEESEARGITGTQYTYVAKWWDFDFDGDLDLFEGNDFGPNHLWLSDGKGRFSDAKTHIFDADTNYTMGVTIADWENDGQWGMYISNMYSHAGNRVFLLTDDMGPEMRRLGLLLAQGNQFYERDRKSGEWRETSVTRRVNWADWAWACLFFDVDNDADRDLWVANGFTTNDDPNAPDY